MVKRCVVMFCSRSLQTGHSVHVFPKNPVLRRQWIRFVEVKRTNFKLTENSVICDAHFEKGCMRNALQTAMGYSVKTLLTPDAVPTIQPAPTEEQMAKARRRASKSKRPPDSRATPSTIQAKVPRKSKAVEKREIIQILSDASVKGVPEQPDERQISVSVSQAEVPESQCISPGLATGARSVGTQCSSLGRHHYRSKGTSTVAPKMVDFSAEMGDGRMDTVTQETCMQCNPAPAVFSTPKKPAQSSLPKIPLSPAVFHRNTTRAVHQLESRGLKAPKNTVPVAHDLFV